MTVKKTLIELFQQARNGMLPAAEATTIMQKYYPGEYVVKEMYDQERMCFTFKPVFTDAKKEMLWRIKYGY